MNTVVKQTFHSLEELLCGCNSSALKNHVSSVLRNNKYVAWNLVSRFAEGDVCRSEFISPMKNSELVQHLSCEINARGQFSHISTAVPKPTGA